jgi:hypothetical protein
MQATRRRVSGGWKQGGICPPCVVHAILHKKPGDRAHAMQHKVVIVAAPGDGVDVQA